MTTATKKYYVMVPPEYSYNGRTYWQELLGVKSLTSAQHYVSEVFGGLHKTEIWTSRGSEIIKVISKKDIEGKWQLVDDHETDVGEPANNHYHLGGHRVSRNDFYKYGFQHEKLNM